MEDTIGIVKVDTGVGTGGVGFLVVPDEIDRIQYIQDCYRTQTVTINGGEGYGYFNAVRCPQSILENLIFPTEESRGTPIVWVKDGMTHLPVVVAWLRPEGDYYALGENQWRVTKGNDKRNVEIFIDGNTADLQISVMSDSEEPANVDIKLTSQNKDSIFNLSSDNEVNVSAVKKMTLTSNSEFNMNIEEKGKIKGNLQYVLGKGFILKDEFENQITTNKDGVQIESKKIDHNSGKEPMVLGNTLVELLSDFLDACQQLTVISPVGQTSIPVNVADFAAVQAKLETIKSKISNLE